jgi:hypothetical protein
VTYHAEWCPRRREWVVMRGSQIVIGCDGARFLAERVARDLNESASPKEESDAKRNQQSALAQSAR